VEWINLAQDREKRWASEHGNETSSSMTGGEFLD
jgi:hypothetical protein